MKIVCLIATWRDGKLLEEACRSAAPYVDAIVVLDGGYQGIVQEYQAWSTDEEMLAAHSVDEKVHIVQLEGLWPGEIEKRNALLDIGRLTAETKEKEPLWALVLDADEELVNGDELADWIDRAEDDGKFGQAIGLQRIEPDGDSYWATSRLFRLTPSTKYAGPSHILTSEEFGEVSIAHQRYPSDPDRMPYIAHHWDRQPEWRLIKRLDGPLSPARTPPTSRRTMDQPLPETIGEVRRRLFEVGRNPPSKRGRSMRRFGQTTGSSSARRRSRGRARSRPICSRSFAASACSSTRRRSGGSEASGRCARRMISPLRSSTAQRLTSSRLG